VSQYGFNLGVTAVDLFFMISGFVIFLTLKKSKNWKDFAISRFSRLYPVYWTVVTFTAILIIIQNGFSVSFGWRYLANMTMFQSYFRQENLDKSYWTMIVEMLFYLYMVVIFVSKKLKAIEIIGSITMLPIFIYSLPFFKYELSGVHKILSGGLPLINHFPLFFAGILFYKIKPGDSNKRSYLLILLCFICQLLLFNDGGRSHYFISLPQYLGMLTIYFLTFILFIKNKLKFLINRYTLFLGSISFSLYLLHEYISLTVIMPWLNAMGMNFYLAMAIDILIVIILAYTITKLIEQPAMRYIRNKYIRRSAAIKKDPVSL
jgi:peptidoglycan/LPS O-acetylase OafA/YrhL